MRAVIDTNLLVAALISRPGSTPRKLLGRVRDGQLTLVLSRPLIDEFLDVMSRPKFARYGITPMDVLEFIAGLLSIASIVEITGAPRGCDDPDDDAVIETAEVGAVDYLITGDSDLLADNIRTNLGRNGIEVVTASAFLRDNLASQASKLTIIDQARMVVAVHAGNAIAVSTLERATLVQLINSIRNDIKSGGVILRKRIAEHKTQFAKLQQCGEDGGSSVSKRAALEADISKTADFQRLRHEIMVEIMRVAEDLSNEIARARRQSQRDLRPRHF